MSTRSALQPASEAADRFTPVYFRIQQRLRAAIASGELKSGEKLPSENMLCAEFSTTRSTVRHALSLLDYEGLIVRQIGRGTFVAPPFSITARIDTGQSVSFEDQVATTGAKVMYRNAMLTRVRAPVDVVARLSLPSNAEVFLLERVRVINERPVGFEFRYLRDDLGQSVTQEMIKTRSVHDFVSEIIGETVPTISVFLFAETADALIAKLLELKKESAVVVREHTYHDSEGRVLLCGRSTFRGDLRLGYTLGRALPSA